MFTLFTLKKLSSLMIINYVIMLINKLQHEIMNCFMSCSKDHLSSEANSIKNKGEITAQYLQHIGNSFSNGSYFLENRATSIDITMLKNIAMMRMCISAAASVLCLNHLGKANEQTDKTQRLLANLMKFITSDKVPNSDAHMFLIRQIVNQFDQRTFQDVCMEFKWINLDRSSDFQKVMFV